ncbi:MAG: hypothetical protein AAF638_05375 [Pseudomonadota bacterium]
MKTASGIFLLVALVAGNASAQQVPPRPPSCASLVAQVDPASLWQGRASGLSNRGSGDKKRGYTGGGCFRSKADCDAWLRIARSYIDYRQNILSCERYR